MTENEQLKRRKRKIRKKDVSLGANEIGVPIITQNYKVLDNYIGSDLGDYWTTSEIGLNISAKEKPLDKKYKERQCYHEDGRVIIGSVLGGYMIAASNRDTGVFPFSRGVWFPFSRQEFREKHYNKNGKDEWHCWLCNEYSNKKLDKLEEEIEKKHKEQLRTAIVTESSNEKWVAFIAGAVILMLVIIAYLFGMLIK